MGLDVGAIRRGALGAVLLFVPVTFILRALAGGDKESSAWVPLVFVFLFAFTFGGWLAAYERPRTPMLHGAVAGAVGFAIVFVLFLVIRAINGTVTGGALVAGVVFLEVAGGLGLLGGLLASRGVRMPR